MRTVLRQLFEQAIDTAYNSGGITNTCMARRVFGNDKPPVILERLNRLYGTPILQDLYQSLLRLHDPMHSNQPVEAMLPTTEEVHMLLMAHPDGDHELSNVNLISYTMIKLSKCGGLYTRDIERWNIKTKTDKNIWENFHQHLISEYEKMLSE